MENLISTTDFNIQQSELLSSNQIDQRQFTERVIKYARKNPNIYLQKL